MKQANWGRAHDSQKAIENDSHTKNLSQGAITPESTTYQPVDSFLESIQQFTLGDPNSARNQVASTQTSSHQPIIRGL